MPGFPFFRSTWHWTLGIGLLLFCLLSPFSSLLAQDTTRAARDTLRKLPDTLLYHRAPVSPMGGFFRSLVLPGWGQAKLGRKLTGGLFIAWEGVTLGMAVKADRELAYLKERGDSADAIDGKRQEREDWLILLAFNHLFAGLEAFVSSHLWDFPRDLRLRNAPQGYGAVVEVPVRLP
jgi:hypothetical protein